MALQKQRQEGKKVSLPLRSVTERERFFRAVLDVLPQAIEVIDRDYNILYMNAAARESLEHTNPVRLGGKCYQIFHQRDEPCVFCPARKTFESGKSGYILINQDQSGETKPRFEELFSLPVKIDQRDPVHWIVALTRDVTREKEIEQQLIHSDRLITLGEMAASIVHEINNPLGIILGFAQDLMTEVDPSDSRHESLRIIEEETQRCRKIMQNLLEFGRPDPPQLVRTNVWNIARKSMDFLAIPLQKHGVQPIVVFQENLPWVWADPHQLEQVLVNLILNAVDAMPQGGELTLQATFRAAAHRQKEGEDPPEIKEVQISVTDTGHGISPLDLSRIFRPFYTTKSRKGMGLGLSICERIVRAHGGRISVESGPLWGATFTIYFPVERRHHERSD